MTTQQRNLWGQVVRVAPKVRMQRQGALQAEASAEGYSKCTVHPGNVGERT
jgi:hypothetical protein